MADTADTVDKLTANLGRNHELTSALGELADAPAALEAAQYRLAQTTADLAPALDAQQKQLRVLERRQKLYYGDWQNILTSTARLKARLRHPRSHGHQTASRAADAQIAYETVFRQVQACLAKIHELEAQGAAAQAEVEAAEARAARYDEIRQERRALYDYVFSGSSEYPDQNGAEDAVLLAKLAVDYCQELEDAAAAADDFCGTVIESIERAAAQFGRERTVEATKLYELARTQEAELNAMRRIEMYPSDLGGAVRFRWTADIVTLDDARQHMCLLWAAHLRTQRSDVIGAHLRQCRDDTRAARATHRVREDELEELRATIFQQREEEEGVGQAPPTYEA